MGIASQTSDRRRFNTRIVLVVVVAILFLGRFAPQIAFYWIPEGTFGVLDASPDGVVHAVAPRSAASEAGLKVGDRIEIQPLTLHQYLIIESVAKPGETVIIHVLRHGEEKILTLVARPTHMSPADIKSDLWGQASDMLLLILGASLVLLRPGRLTWLFYLWLASLGTANTPEYFFLLPGWLFIAVSLPYAVMAGAVPFVGTLFCLVFPADEPTGWRRRAVPFVTVALWVSVAITLARFVGFTFKLDTTGSDWFPTVEDTVGGLLSVAAMVAYYFESRGVDRQRVRWVIVVFVTASLGEIVWNIKDILAPGTPAPFYGAFYLQWTGWFIFIAFAYAILRYRMFDVEFVLSRALVYSLLAIAAIGIFLAIDFAFTSRFHGSRAEVAVDIAVALGIGFWVRAIHGSAVDLVDRALFRRRFESRRRLKAASDMLAFADSTRAVEEIVTSSAASSLGLASAVFFRRVADGGLLREIGFGWPTDAPWHLLSDDKVVETLERNAPPSFDLQSLGWSRAGATPPNQPVLVVPMQSGRRVIGVTFYGSRLNGVLPSPDEISALVDLSRRAASIYVLLDSARSATTTPELASMRISR